MGESLKMEGGGVSSVGFVLSFFGWVKGLSLPDKDSMKTWKSVVVEEARGLVEGLNISRREGMREDGSWERRSSRRRNVEGGKIDFGAEIFLSEKDWKKAAHM